MGRTESKINESKYFCRRCSAN